MGLAKSTPGVHHCTGVARLQFTPLVLSGAMAWVCSLLLWVEGGIKAGVEPQQGSRTLGVGQQRFSAA